MERAGKGQCKLQLLPWKAFPRKFSNNFRDWSLDRQIFVKMQNGLFVWMYLKKCFVASRFSYTEELGSGKSREKGSTNCSFCHWKHSPEVVKLNPWWVLDRQIFVKMQNPLIVWMHITKCFVASQPNVAAIGIWNMTFPFAQADLQVIMEIILQDIRHSTNNWCNTITHPYQVFTRLIQLMSEDWVLKLSVKINFLGLLGSSDKVLG